MNSVPNRLPRSTPEEQGISSNVLLGFIQEAEQKINALHSFMLVRHGHVVTEGWWSPYAAEEPHAVYSISKSFISTAVGLAVVEGKLSIDEPIVNFFPDKVPANPSANLKSMRIRDLLRLSTGHRPDDLSEFPYQSKADLVKTFLEIPVPEKPGTHFIYDEPGVYLLSAIIQKVTGQSALDYLRPRLFEPLGIKDPAWWASAQGTSLGASGLSIRTEDIASFGLLYLQRGQRLGRQLIPASWVDAATSMQTATGSDPSGDWDQGYGYLFWRLRHGCYGGMGLLGQMCIVMPEHDAVIAITSATNDAQSVLNLVWDRLAPAFGKKALPADVESNRKLSAKLEGLTLPMQSGAALSPIVPNISGRKYSFPVNAQKIEFIELNSNSPSSSLTIEVQIAGKVQRIACGKGQWVKGALDAAAGGLVPMTGYLGGEDDARIPIAVNGAWGSEDTYTVSLCRYRTAFASTYDMRFAGDELILERSSLGAEDSGWTRVIGKLPS